MAQGGQRKPLMEPYRPTGFSTLRIVVLSFFPV
jgi:hypothetical protein